MNAKDEGQQWREVWPTDSHEWFISEVTNGNSVFPVLQDYAEDLVNLLNALQQQVTELEGKAARWEALCQKLNQQAANLAVEKVALEERVRVLEEALRDINETVQGHFNGDDLLILRRWLPALLPSPVLPGSTEGGEGS